MTIEGKIETGTGNGNPETGNGNPESGVKYRHSLETRAKMSLRSGRRRAVFVGDVRYASLQEAAMAEGISYASFQMRLNRGWDGYRYDVG
jgi:hypothetical protein